MSELVVQFFVCGRPRPGGSKSPFVNPKTGKVLVAPASPHTKAWRKKVRFAAIEAMDGRSRAEGPMRLEIDFHMRRPLQHHVGNRADRPLRDGAPTWHTCTPDTTKLVRSTEDALKGIVWWDDGQVAEQATRKLWAAPGTAEGAMVRVWALADGAPPPAPEPGLFGA